MNHLLDVDVRDLPPIAGARVIPREPELPPLSPRMRGLLDKEASIRAMLGENEERWPQEVYEELMKQHPWMSSLSVSVHMTTTNSDGFGVGYFHVAPGKIPASTATEDTVNIITVPVLIRDFRVYPFDTFAFQGSFYPLKQDRVMSLLRMRDAFTEVDRAEQRRLIRNHQFPLTLREQMNPNNQSSAKISSPAALATLATDSFLTIANEKRVMKMSNWVRNELIADPAIRKDVFTLLGFELDELAKKVSTKTSESKRHPQVDTLVKSLQEPLYVEYTCDGSKIGMRAAWASDPTDGAAKVSALVEVPFSLAEAYLGSDIEQILPTGRLIRNMNQTEGYAVDQTVRAAIAKVSADERAAFEKQSKIVSGPTAACVTQEFIISDGYEDIGAVKKPRRVLAATINCFSPPDRSYSDSRSTAGLLTSDGTVIAVEPYNVSARAVRVVDASCSDPSTFEYVREKDPPSYRRDQEDKYDGMVVWEQDGYLYGISVMNQKVDVAGEEFYAAGSGGPAFVALKGGLKRAFLEHRGDFTVTTVPEGAWLVMRNEGVVVKGNKLSCSSTSGKSPGVVTSLDQPSPSMTPGSSEVDKVSVMKTGPNYKVSSPALQVHFPRAQDSTDRDGARRALALSGVCPLIEQALLKTAEEHGYAEGYYTPKEYNRGAVAAQKVEAEVKRSRAALPKVSEKKIKQMRKVAVSLTELEKKSGVSLGPSIDASLALGFLSEDNLLKYVDLIPAFESCLSQLSALLVASRMGLDEISESSAVAAVRSLDDVIRDLRSVEFALIRR